MVNIRKGVLIILVITFLLISLSEAAVFELNGTVYDLNGNPLNNSNVSIALKDNTWTDLGTNFTTTNASGWFGVNITSNASYFYLLSIFHVNETFNHIDWVGQSLPSLPYQEFSLLGGNLKFYLDQAGTINITVRNSSNTQIQFSAQVKDVQLGYPVSCTSSNGSTIFTCYVPKNRNYSIMIYPSSNDPGSNRFVPLSFNWNNFSATSSYTITDNNGASLSSYNATTSRLDKQFNCTMAFSRVSGYLNNTLVGNFMSWTNITVVTYLVEPGNMIFANYGTMPYNMSAWRVGNNQTDSYNLSTGIANFTSFFNITVPYAPAEDTNYILYFSTQNGSNFTGSYKNITVSSATHIFNATLYGLLGETSSINLSYPMSSDTHSVNTKKLKFSFVNSTTNQTLSGLSAHIETQLDYTNFGMGFVFTFMNDLDGSATSQYFVPMLNISGIKEINIYSMTNSPKRIPKKTVAQIIANPNITLTSFNPGDINGEIENDDISVSIYKSNSSCDVPVPPSSCLMTSTSTMDSFNPLAAIMGGGDVSFRMTMDGVTVHYVNVDLFASGPPDAMFDDDDTSAERTTDGFSKALRFGSQGPSIYSYILIAIPYTEGSSSNTGLNENVDTNMSIPVFYDENWNVVWNTTLNGTSGAVLAANDSHYSTYASEWTTLMGSTNCTTDQSLLSASIPCYKDKTNNKIWIRLPHFSGTSPQITGAVVTASTTSSSSSSGSSTAEGRSSLDDEEEIISLALEKDETISLTSETSFVELEESSKVSFDMTTSSGLTESHTLEVDKITDSTITFTIFSEPQTFTLAINEFVVIDLDLDSLNDLKISLVEISNGKANLKFELISDELVNPPIEGEKNASYTWLVVILLVILLTGIIFYFLLRK